MSFDKEHCEGKELVVRVDDPEEVSRIPLSEYLQPGGKGGEW